MRRGEEQREAQAKRPDPDRRLAQLRSREGGIKICTVLVAAKKMLLRCCKQLLTSARDKTFVINHM
jgi:hypothetical protein